MIFSKILNIDLDASSFDGITYSTSLGSELVSTIAKIGMFNFLASFIAICSLIISTTNKAPGNLVMSDMEPRFFSNFSLNLSVCNLSFLDNVLNVPSFFILSIAAIFLTAFLIVTKFVNIPPGHLSVIYGMFTFEAASATISLACFFVATNKIFLPEAAIFFRASAASSILATVL